MDQTYGMLKKKVGWWIFGKWESVYKTKDKFEAYKEYFKLKYNIDLKQYREFPHNKKKGEKCVCKFQLEYDKYTNDYIAGYKPDNYYRYYYCQTSKESYEDAILRVINGLYLQDIINKNKDN